MNSGKTHAFFAWAAENAMVPSLTGERRPDYVAKADDDSFIMLGEMEKRLRVLGGVKVYWGCESTPHSCTVRLLRLTLDHCCFSSQT